MNFIESEATLENYWRAIILFGRNTASYKFALAKSLIDLSLESKSDLITLEDLALPYALHLCEHLKHSPRQITANSSKFLEACTNFNNGTINESKLIEITVQKGFNNVLDAFHIVNTEEIKEKFFLDERKENKGIRLTNNLLKLFYVFDHSAENLNCETESRWSLVEKAWQLKLNKNLVAVEFDQDTKNLFTHDPKHRRISITSSRGALNGYQKSKCFYCFKDINIIPSHKMLADVDHFFPHVLKPYVETADCCRPVNVDGIWNLVLSCQECNRGESGKFQKIPVLSFLERLNTRNEYLIGSHHPLRETLILQTGTNQTKRKEFLQKSYCFSKEHLLQTWQPKPQGISKF